MIESEFIRAIEEMPLDDFIIWMVELDKANREEENDD